MIAANDSRTVPIWQSFLVIIFLACNGGPYALDIEEKQVLEAVAKVEGASNRASIHHRCP